MNKLRNNGNLASQYESYSDSDVSDSAGEEFTVIKAGGITTGCIHGVEIHEQKGVCIHAPQLRNIQVGNGRVAIIGGAAPQTSHDPTAARKHHVSEDQMMSGYEKPVKCLTDSHKPPSVSDLNHICNNVGKVWKKLARALGHSKAVIETIKMDYGSEGVYEMTWQAILKWRRKRVNDVKLCDIARILDDIGLEQLARELPVDR